MQAEFRAPKRRTRVYQVYEGPLPLNQDQTHFRADLINNQVLIRDPLQIKTLYNQGFFGKGVLSRSGPAHRVFEQWENHEGLLLPVVSHGRQDPQNPDSPGPGPGFFVPGSGFVLVRSDSELNQREIRRVPFSVTEFLQVSPEEAFFLVYALGCLTVYLHQEPLSVLKLWRTFRSLGADFVSSYTAYHFFRSRGWIPKTGSGAKYGADMMLYRKGPPFYHASYSVVVERLQESDSALRPFSWRSLSALSRITGNVSKELLLCYVIFPADQSEAELESPDCLKRLSVQDVVVSRWVSSRERTEQDEL